MSHYPSIAVLSPRKNVRNVVHIYQNTDFALAKVTWNGTDRIAIRWNVTENELKNPDKVSGKVICIGEPNSRGYPTWFILPTYFLKLLTNGSNIATDIKNILLDIENNNEL